FGEGKALPARSKIRFHCSRNYSSGCANISTADIYYSRCLKISFFGFPGKLRSGNSPSVTLQLHPEDYEALASFRYAMRKFLSFSRRALAEEAQLTPEQYEALLALKAFSDKTGFSIS